MNSKLAFGLPGMRAEAGERRAFLPETVASLVRNGGDVVLEHGYGSGMGLAEEDYRRMAPPVAFASYDEVYRQDYVLVLRCPAEQDLRRLRPGACLISMLHYPTRPERVALLRELGIEAVSLDSIKDDSGRRLVENLRSVAWNGIDVAMQTLKDLYPDPGFESPLREPIRVTLLGAGAVGMNVLQAATRYGNSAYWQALASRGVPGVQVTAVDYDTTRYERLMRPILSNTDLLVDATQRPDPTKPVIPNAWLSYLPSYAVVLDLSVDPYDCNMQPVYVKGIEGIPQGNLDQYVFAPDDPAFDAIPGCVNNTQRRFAVSCYSWPGIHPKECMEVYGHQLRPLLRKLVEKGGIHNIHPEGGFFERALSRAMLSRWRE